MMKKNQSKWVQKILFMGKGFARKEFFRIACLTIFCMAFSLSQIIAAETRSLDENNEAVEQQQNSVSGVVTDQSGLPVPGVAVLVVGTNNGIVTDVKRKVRTE